jgi:hypothetical protein
MQMRRVRYISPTAMLICAMVTFAPMALRAEVITLDCFHDKSVFVIDTVGNTVEKKFPGYATANLTDVAITDNTISFTSDFPGAFRQLFQIDRTTGTYNFQTRFYPGNTLPAPREGSGNCTRIPNKAF